MVVDNSEVAEVLGGYAPRWISCRRKYPQAHAQRAGSVSTSCASTATTASSPQTSPESRGKSAKNLIYALHSSKVVLLCVHRLLRIVAVPPCTKKRTVPIPREGTNRKNQGDKV